MENSFSNIDLKKSFQKDYPILSIVTVVYNAELHLERTIASIQSQNYANIEHIIIDGASKDKSLEIIKKHQSKIYFWVSEKDNGIYDAMNKGLAKASGDYVLFLNAGDTLFGTDCIAKVFSNPPADIYYGDTMIVDEFGNQKGKRRLPLPENLTWKNIGMGMVVCHQSFIPRREICPNYNLNFRISADIDWTINCLKSAKKIHNTHQFICNFLEGGMSHTNMKKGLVERFKILNNHFGLVNNLVNHLKISFRLLNYLINK